MEDFLCTSLGPVARVSCQLGCGFQRASFELSFRVRRHSSSVLPGDLRARGGGCADASSIGNSHQMAGCSRTELPVSLGVFEPSSRSAETPGQVLKERSSPAAAPLCCSCESSQSSASSFLRSAGSVETFRPETSEAVRLGASCCGEKLGPAGQTAENATLEARCRKLRNVEQEGLSSRLSASAAGPRFSRPANTR